MSTAAYRSELLIVSSTVAAICLTTHGRYTNVSSLISLLLLSILVDTSVIHSSTGCSVPYDTRCPQHGIIIGFMAMPCLFGALAAIHSSGVWPQLLHAATLMSVFSLALLTRRSHVAPAWQPAYRRQQPRDMTSRGFRVGLLLALTAAAAAMMFHSHSSLPAVRMADPMAAALNLSPAPALLAWGMAGVATFHCALSLLPRCFTLGEAAVVSQAWLFVVVASMATHQTSHTAYSQLPQPAPARSDVFAATSLPCNKPLSFGPLFWGSNRHNPEPLDMASDVNIFVLRLITCVTLLALGLAVILHAVRHAPFNTATAVASSVDVPSSSRQQLAPQCQLWLWLILSAGMATVVAMGWFLLDLALWVLFVFLPQALVPRLAMLAYWAVLLTLALPLLLWLLQPSRVAPVQPQRTMAGQQRRSQDSEEEDCSDKGLSAKAAAGLDGTVCDVSAMPRRRDVAAAPPQRTVPDAMAGPARLTAGQEARSPSHSAADVTPARLPGSWHVPHIIVRKGYHLLALALFFPVEACDVAMLQVSVAIAVAVLVAVEVLRCSRLVPFISDAVQHFMQGFVDDRDAGAVYITHFTLLLGMAAPLWLRDMAIHIGRHSTRVFGCSGMVALGLGDTAASVVGHSWGTHRIFAGSSKTWEGTAAGAAAMLLGWGLLATWPALWAEGNSAHEGLAGSAGNGANWAWWLKLALATCGAAALEASTQQLDNLMVPIYYCAWLLLM